MLRVALARVTLAAAALCGHAELHLDVVKAHAVVRSARDVTVTDAAADTNDHSRLQKAQSAWVFQADAP
jgi:hypothetical protein